MILRKMTLGWLLVWGLVGGVIACDSNPSNPPADAAVPPPCSDGRRPVVMAHGFLASGDTWATQAQRFASNGYCPDSVFAFDYNTLDQGASDISNPCDCDIYGHVECPPTGKREYRKFGEWYIKL